MSLHRRLPSFLVQLLVIICLAALVIIASAAAATGDKTYYEILDVDQDASLQTIKKAYRKLALEHHPDRNKGNEKQAEIIFRDISEAYEVLSDEKSRNQYDQKLKYYGRNNFSQSTYSNNFRRSSQYRDPFTQFNDLFQNDDFFKSAAKGMEDLFKLVFEEGDNNNQGQRRRRAATGGGGGGTEGRIQFSTNFGSSSSSSSSFFGGSSGTTTTTRKSSWSWGSGGGGGGSSSSSYESRSTRTVIENGKRITIQSLEKNGNKIEEKYIGEKLIERRINGQIDTILLEGGRGEGEGEEL